MVREDIQEYLEGKKLYGDDFITNDLQKWFNDEMEAYANLADNTNKLQTKQDQSYGYYGLNQKYGFRYLPTHRKYSNVLGFGSAFGLELKPILGQVDNLTIVEPSDSFKVSRIDRTPVTYVKPKASGLLDFPDNYFDLITCFGVLHHIANVSTVVSEFYRCLKPSGYALIREPMVSMGDWRGVRPGLTSRERGIPITIFKQIISSANFSVINEEKCMFSLTRKLKLFSKDAVYNSPSLLVVDKFLSRLFSWNEKYHSTNVFEKLRPTSVFFVLQK